MCYLNTIFYISSLRKVPVLGISHGNLMTQSCVMVVQFVSQSISENGITQEV